MQVVARSDVVHTFRDVLGASVSLKKLDQDLPYYILLTYPLLGGKRTDSNPWAL